MFGVLQNKWLDLRLLLCAGAVSIGVFGLFVFGIAVGGGNGLSQHRAQNIESEMNAGELVNGLFKQERKQDASVSISRRESAGSELNAAERRRVIQAVINNLRDHYFDHVLAQRMTHELLIAESGGNYNGITSGTLLANLLTRQIREISEDMHLEVVYSERPLPDMSVAPIPGERAQYCKALRQGNCAFEKVQILPRNIGYIKLNSFPDPEFCASKAKTVMTSLNNVEALILDLRNNRGGAPEMVDSSRATSSAVGSIGITRATPQHDSRGRARRFREIDWRTSRGWYGHQGRRSPAASSFAITSKC
jgi:Peptidase family S41/N-terminal domain of Peptidase_S41 in eukaryotic IRBP